MGLAALQAAVQRTNVAEEQEVNETPRPVQFRPERPLPVLRQDIREDPPAPIPRQEPPQPPTRLNLRQQTREEFIARPQPTRQPQQVRASTSISIPLLELLCQSTSKYLYRVGQTNTFLPQLRNSYKYKKKCSVRKKVLDFF